jgi:hypothetical protein
LTKKLTYDKIINRNLPEGWKMSAMEVIFTLVLWIFLVALIVLGGHVLVKLLEEISEWLSK